MVCEFSRPVIGSFDFVYSRYLVSMIPVMARLVSSNPDSYEYLAESIKAWPGQAEFARVIQRSGWKKVAWRNLSLGIVALHRAYKPAS
nr:hypothetical protein GCM10020093_082270 [Planobispora longispora]